MNHFLSVCMLTVLFAGGSTIVARAQDYEPCREDFDGNYTVGLEDQITMTDCFTGPGVDNKDINCVPADFDRDHHIDLRDLAKLTPKSGPCHLCAMKWAEDTFCLPGVNGEVYASIIWDDGSGPALFVAGDFSIAGCTLANNIARWDGTKWSSLGPGLGGTVRALAVFDDGTGPALYAGGGFYVFRNIAKWDGSEWSYVRPGLEDAVRVLTVFDDGNGPALYVGGLFPGLIKRWDGTEWSEVGTGLCKTFGTLGCRFGSVESLAVYDDENDSALYVGGSFDRAGDVPTKNLAKWDGSTWSPLGSSVVSGVQSLVVFDDGDGLELYVGGHFHSIGSVVVKNIAKWNGMAWSPLGSGLDYGTGNPMVRSLVVFDDGSGRALYAGGAFGRAGGATARGIAKWDGASWIPLEYGLRRPNVPESYVTTLGAYDDGSPPALYVGGSFSEVGSDLPMSVAANGIARWNGVDWSSLGTGVTNTINAVTCFDDGNGEALYAGSIGYDSSDHIAKWDGTVWSSLVSGISGWVRALAPVSNEGSDLLYAGGSFDSAGGITASKIARWDGTSWSPVSSGINSSGVRALTVFDNGGGSTLYAGGFFTNAGGIPATCIATWDGSMWSALGSGLNDWVHTIAIGDDDEGAAVYAGGTFTMAGAVPVSHIAKWDGASWSPLGSGMNDAVKALVMYDDGTGMALYAAGEFTEAGSSAAAFIAKWDGLEWAQVGNWSGGSLESLAVFDDGKGLALYAGDGCCGRMNVSRWNGLSWTQLGSGFFGQGDTQGIYALSTCKAGGGPALLAGGSFFTVDSKISVNTAKWYRPSECKGPPEMSKGE